MPRCNNCGNTKTLAGTLVPVSTPTANPSPYGLPANFDNNGCIDTMECQGADLDDAQNAFERPELYFNACPVCGSDDILWHV